MGRIVINNGIKWDYDWKLNRYEFIEYVTESQEKDLEKSKNNKGYNYPKGYQGKMSVA